MKKIIGVAAFAVLGMVALSSCKKEYACSCTTTSGVITEMHSGGSAEDACADATSVLEGKVCTAQ